MVVPSGWEIMEVESVKCKVCMLPMKDPFLFVCGHSFCKVCMYMTMAEQTANNPIETENGKFVLCPECRTPSDLKKLHLNSDLKQLSDNVCQLLNVNTLQHHVTSKSDETTAMAKDYVKLYMTSVNNTCTSLRNTLMFASETMEKMANFDDMQLQEVTPEMLTDRTDATDSLHARIREIHEWALENSELIREGVRTHLHATVNHFTRTMKNLGIPINEAEANRRGIRRLVRDHPAATGYVIKDSTQLLDLKLIACSYCNQTMSTPCQLSCGHSYCKNCIENMKEVQEEANSNQPSDDSLPDVSQDSGTTIQCPTCHRPTNIPQNGLAVNIMLEKLISEYQLQRNVEMMKNVVKNDAKRAEKLKRTFQEELHEMTSDVEGKLVKMARNTEREFEKLAQLQGFSPNTITNELVENMVQTSEQLYRDMKQEMLQTFSFTDVAFQEDDNGKIHLMTKNEEGRVVQFNPPNDAAPVPVQEEEEEALNIEPQELGDQMANPVAQLSAESEAIDDLVHNDLNV